MEAWQEASGGQTARQRTTTRSQAIIKIYWVDSRAPDYMAKPAAATSMSGPTRVKDCRARPSVYLTCLHETGHALGLPYCKFRRILCTTFSMAEISRSTLAVIPGN